MQNHLDSSGRNNSSTNNNSFSAMLNADPFGSNGGGGPPSHDFTTLTNSNHNGTEFGHLLSNNNNHQHHHHHHHSSSHHGNSNNNNNPSPITATDNHSNSGVNSSSNAKPKKPPPPNGKKTKGRVKIKMEFIDNKLRRYTTFSKRKTGIMKKAYELSTLTGTQVMLLVASETGHVYTFATRKLQPMITSEAGKALIQTCLNSPDPPNSVSDTQRMSATGYEETELTYAADPNASDHGDIKDDDSEMSGSCSDGGDDQKDGHSGAPLLPLNNGLLPPNFAALFASASAAGLTGATTKGGLSIGLIPSSEIRSSSSSRSSLPHHHPISSSSSSSTAPSSSSSATITITPTSTPAVTLSRIKSEK